ncbi:hypothetical protein [Nonomuraea sp. NPDC048916]|uniref:hypothetical protein n=1 Tax=Nonomuraea sp. NPDC048916 TaxID=3154232 RepID=UPI00340900AE
MGKERKVLIIRSFEATPQGETVPAPKAEIERLLSNTKPGDISGAGSAYGSAAQAIDRAVTALSEHADRLAKVWKGPTAAQVQKAMQLMHASGVELSSKMKLMDEALGIYAEKLPESLAKVQNISVDIPAPTNDSIAAEKAFIQAHKAEENVQAQKVMRELNQKIVEVLDFNVPMDVSYELPTVTIPGGGGPSQRPVVLTDLPAGSGGPYTVVGQSANGDPYSPAEGSRGNGSNGSGSGPGGGDPTGSDPTGTDPTGTDPAGPGDSGSNGPGSEATGPGSTNGTGPNTATTQHQTGLTDNAVPSVIGRDDPRHTEVASFTPQATTTASPYIGTPYTGAPHMGTTTAPTTFIPAPTGSTPSVPSVLGAPGSFGGSAGGGPTSSGRSPGAGTGMPPLMPMGMGGGTSEEGVETGTNLSEERDVWASAHVVTEPRIG